MSSGPASHNPEADPEDEAIAETTECPSCGRRFVGHYCPGCGQEANPSTSAIGVVGGFFRELVDLESGLWPTLVDLSLNPGGFLRRYLNGARTGMVSPGRYLLASVLILVAVRQGLVRLGTLESIRASVSSLSSVPDEEDKAYEVVEVFLDAVGQAAQSQWFDIAATLLLAGTLSFIFWRLFQQKMRGWPEAFAASVFVVGHYKILLAGITLLWVPAAFLLTGDPVSLTAYSLPSYPALAIYVGAVAYSLRPEWKSALKGALGGVWAHVEMIGAMYLPIAGYLLWEVRSLREFSAAGQTFLGLLGAIYLAPILLHAAAEGYWRLR